MQRIRPFEVVAWIGLLMWGATANAQPHQVTTGDGYTLHVSTVSSMDIAEVSAAHHGIHRSPDRAVVNVTLMKGASATAPAIRAYVDVEISDLTGTSKKVDMTEQGEDYRVSYFGTFTHVPREVLDFDVTARPRTGGPPVTIRFRERMGPAGRP